MSEKDEGFFNLSLEELGKIQISAATGNSKTLDRAPATASVVTAAEIRAMGARTLDDVLDSIPGVHLSLSSINRLDSIISVRGVHTGFNPHVLLLMNGVPVTYNIYAGRPIMFRLPVTSISRIEVIRGPGSAVYGADAFSGVINVITRDPNSPESTDVGGRLGSFEGRDFWFSSVKKINSWGASLDLSYLSSAGDPDRIISEDGQTFLDNVFMTSASLAPGALATRYEVFDVRVALANNHWNIDLWSWTSWDSGNGAGGAQALDPKGGDDSRLYMVDIGYSADDVLQNWEFSPNISYFHYTLEADFNLFPPGAVLPMDGSGNLGTNAADRLVSFPEGVRGKPEVTSEDLLFDFASVYTGFDKHRWRIALGGGYNSADSSENKNFGPGITDGSEAVVNGALSNVSDTEFVFLKDISRTTGFVSVQDEWQLAENWELTAGLRYDHFSDFGDTTNPRAALVWQSHENLTTKILYGSAFRAPSFSELFFINNPVSLGNPELEPEKIETFELSFNYRATKELQLNLSLFRYDAKDMIEYLESDSGAGDIASVAQNSRDQRGKGGEVEFNWRPHARFTVNGSFSLQRSNDDESGDPVADAPRRLFKISSHWEFRENFLINASYNLVADRVRRTQNPRSPVDDYGLLDITLRAKNIMPDTDLTLMIRNVAGEAAMEPSEGLPNDYPLESRGIWAEISYSFN